MQSVETKLAAARTKLILDKPFLGALVLRLPMKAASEAWCPTVATDARAFYYNADYINELTLDDLRRFGMTVPRWSVLSQLAVRDGRSIGDLARATVIKQSSLTRVVDQMERDGLVERTRESHDRRLVTVRLTDDGGRRLVAAYERQNRVEQDFFGDLPDRDRLRLTRELAELMIRDVDEE